MASINFNFFDNWFNKPPNPLPPVNLLPLMQSLSTKASRSPNFACISSSNQLNSSKKPETESTEPGYWQKMLDQFFWEHENLPDYRHAPEVEKILNELPYLEKKESPTEEEIKANEKWWEEFKSNPVIQFMSRSEEIVDTINDMELKANQLPYRWGDRHEWRNVTHVIGPDGRPMPRKAIKTREESDDKFWDFARQFFFGLWGFRQRPYPSSRPIDIAQTIS